VSLNPQHITEVRWWSHARFQERDSLEAAELVAFDVFEPALRSRGNIGDRAYAIAGDAPFRALMTGLFHAEPTGRLILPSLQDALERIASLESRVKALEERGRGQ
jgi:hypothetical protein